LTQATFFFEEVLCYEYLAAFGIPQASLTLHSLARYFSSWHSKQASSAHDLAKTFVSEFHFMNVGGTRHCIQVNLMTLLSFARHFRENGR
jgi:hypothetical protein